jgi:antitoxin component YwqK of YwqJK toxin-antitoxin module
MNKRNEQGQAHGPWEWYYHHLNGNLSYKANYLNGEPHGSWEWYYPNGKLAAIEYFIR